MKRAYLGSATAGFLLDIAFARWLVRASHFGVCLAVKSPKYPGTDVHQCEILQTRYRSHDQGAGRQLSTIFAGSGGGRPDQVLTVRTDDHRYGEHNGLPGCYKHVAKTGIKRPELEKPATFDADRPSSTHRASWW